MKIFRAINPVTKQSFSMQTKDKEKFIERLKLDAERIAGWTQEELDICIKNDMIEEN